MASKRIYGSTNNEFITSSIVCESVANVAGNYSTVNLSGRLSRTNAGYTTGGWGTFYLTVNNQPYENYGYFEITYNSDTVVVTVKDLIIYHNADGKKTIDISFTGSIPISSLSSVNCSGTFQLDNIPRESAVSTDVTSIRAGREITVNLNRAVSTYTHDVTFKIGNRSETVKGVGASVKWTVPKSWQDQFPNAQAATMSITAVTKNGNTNIGTTATGVTVIVSEDAAPNLSASVEGVNLYWGLYIRTKSKAKISLEASGNYGASISRYSISGGGYSGNTNPYTTGFLLHDGDVIFTCTVTDSRGMASTVNVKINVQPYDPPQILRPEVHRTDESGTEQRNGTYIYVKATRGFSDCDGNNTAVMTVQYKEVSESFGSAVQMEDGIPLILGDGEIETNRFYTVRISISDLVSDVVYQDFKIPTNKFRAVFGTESAGILEYPPDGGTGLFVPSLNNVYFKQINIYAGSSVAIKSSFSDFSGAGDVRQAILYFGAVTGVIIVDNSGAASLTTLSGTDVTGVTTEDGGIVRLNFKRPLYEVLVLISGRSISV